MNNAVNDLHNFYIFYIKAKFTFVVFTFPSLFPDCSTIDCYKIQGYPI